MNLVCPSCGSEDVMGHEISTIYDGVLFWSCLACLYAWARDWTGYGSRQDAADRAAVWFMVSVDRPTPTAEESA